MKNIFLVGGVCGLAAMATACGSTQRAVVVPVTPLPAIVRPAATVIVRPAAPVIVAPVLVQPRGVVVKSRTTVVQVKPTTNSVRKIAQPAQPVQRAPGN
jgi:hypothetical protein